jgi:hypothetical protein
VALYVSNASRAPGTRSTPANNPIKYVVAESVYCAGFIRDLECERGNEPYTDGVAHPPLSPHAVDQPGSIKYTSYGIVGAAKQAAFEKP